MSDNPRGPAKETTNRHSLYVLLISIHGLIRANDLELGRDADTGGQTKYVVELATALAENAGAERVELLTIENIDPAVSADYAESVEPICDGADIIRISCGVDEYLPKEALWDHLDRFVDNTIKYLKQQERMPDLIHSHYADAGYVGCRLSHLLGIPLIHTGHSLGRSKRRRLLSAGLTPDEIEKRYNISRRIEAEEETLGVADLVMTSTHQEIEEQYGAYEYYHPDKMRVIPPGTDLNRFYPPMGEEWDSEAYQLVAKFLEYPIKPMILALSRPDKRKNISTLIEVYGESKTLQSLANLIIIVGNRDDINEMEEGSQEVLKSLLLDIDRYDLYGKVAYPKYHSSEHVPVFYRLAALSNGVFINPALTEPFGLTLIEAAATGVPIVATEDGGPRDILENCKNGFLVDPLDHQDIESKLIEILDNKEQWDAMSVNGLVGVHKQYRWDAHADGYLREVTPLIGRTVQLEKLPLQRRKQLYHDRAIFSDLDNNLIGDKASLAEFVKVLQKNRKHTTFGIATGRRLDSALRLIKQYDIPRPDILITSLGTGIYYGNDLDKDQLWPDHIEHGWNPKKIRKILSTIPGLALQPKSEQSDFKISYYYDEKISPDVADIIKLLLNHEQTVNVNFAFGQYVDIVPMRASKGFALRWCAGRVGIALDNILACGGSGSDEDMMRGNTLGVVVANRHDEELSELSDIDRIYFAETSYSAGILEAIDYYNFFESD